MPEIKRFKHPLGLSSYFPDFKHEWAEDQPEQYEIYTAADGYQQFPLDEWDIEVTFTKKLPVLEPGRACYRTSWSGTKEAVTVIAVHEDYVLYEGSDGDYYLGKNSDFSLSD